MNLVIKMLIFLSIFIYYVFDTNFYILMKIVTTRIYLGSFRHDKESREFIGSVYAWISWIPYGDIDLFILYPSLLGVVLETG